MARFTIIVTTGNRLWAGTNSNVSIQMFDQAGRQTPGINLDNPNHDDFERGHQDVFHINVNGDFAPIQEIEVTKDNAGRAPAWFLQTVVVINEDTGSAGLFTFEHWFSRRSGLVHRAQVVALGPPRYSVRIKTSLEDSAGTDADVRIRLHGTNGVVTDAVLLDHPNHNDFERGSVEQFMIPTNDQLQAVGGVTLSHDNSGTKPGWMPAFVEVTNLLLGTVQHVWVQQWLARDEEDGRTERYYALVDEPAEEIGDLYWCARDRADVDPGSPTTWANPAGNHHFLTFMFRSQAAANAIRLPAGVAYQMEEKDGRNYYFLTLAGFAAGLGEPLRIDFNDGNDVFAVREYIDSDEHVHWYSPDFDYEGHYIRPLLGNSERQQIEAVIQAAQNFMGHDAATRPTYDLLDRNCATVVNSLLRALGYPAGYREAKGEFDGVDWGEEDLIDVSLFQPPA